MAVRIHGKQIRVSRESDSAERRQADEGSRKLQRFKEHFRVLEQRKQTDRLELQQNSAVQGGKKIRISEDFNSLRRQTD